MTVSNIPSYTISHVLLEFQVTIILRWRNISTNLVKFHLRKSSSPPTSSPQRRWSALSPPPPKLKENSHSRRKPGKMVESSGIKEGGGGRDKLSEKDVRFITEEASGGRCSCNCGDVEYAPPVIGYI